MRISFGSVLGGSLSQMCTSWALPGRSSGVPSTMILYTHRTDWSDRSVKSVLAVGRAVALLGGHAHVVIGLAAAHALTVVAADLDSSLSHPCINVHLRDLRQGPALVPCGLPGQPVA
jgi:hypothetical protein